MSIEAKSRRVDSQRSKMSDFQIEDLLVSVEGKEILKGITLGIGKGEVHAVM